MGNELESLIEEAVAGAVSGLSDVSVAFSGGLDSSLVAMLAARSARVTCVVAGLPRCRDFSVAEESAGLLGLPLKRTEFSITGELVAEIVGTIGTDDRMRVGIAAPFFVLCRRLGEPVLLTGQGADELFLGYARYYRLPPAAAAAESFKDVLDLLNVPGVDSLAAGASGVELRNPFLDRALVEHVMALPAEDKAADPVLRKAVLRKAAVNLGLPAAIADRPKKALQYSTGVDAGLAKLEKR